MITTVVFVIILGILIFVHELGHFLVARRNGIKADEFGFGFPPRLFGFVKNEESGKYEIIFGNKEIKNKNTVYSLNWIPLGGFVKIKGENGDGKNEQDSFASKGAWPRVKVLAAGVIMNFLLAWALISFGLMIGAPEAIEPGEASNPSSKIQISAIMPDSPADKMGLKIGDEILKNQQLGTVKDIQNYAKMNAGREITLSIKRGNQVLDLRGNPRADAPEGQGPLGISLAETIIVKYSWYEAIWKGIATVVNMILFMVAALVGIISSLFSGQGVSVDIAGPVGIAVLTKQFTELGLVYLLNFAAMLSINLGIINAFPFPALDGGRILFIIIEKIKGSPISQKTEQIANTTGFALLIALMIFITFRDVVKLIG